MRLFSFILVLLVVLAPCSAVSAEVYRCGNLYQDHPCASGEIADIAPDSQGLDVRSSDGKDVSRGDLKNRKLLERSVRQSRQMMDAAMCRSLYGQEPSQIDGTCPALVDGRKRYGPADKGYQAPVGTITRSK